jgi:hypothetical protein
VGVGVGAGVTLFVGLDDGLVPTAFVAVTVKAYETPSVRPVTTWVRLVLPASESTPPDGIEVTV